MAEHVRESASFLDGAALVTTQTPYLAPSGRLEAPWPSSLIQGLSLALFDGLAAAGVDDAVAFANQLARGYLVPIAEGGFTRRYGNGVFFEEYPTSEPSHSLPGHAIASVALRSHLSVSSSVELANLAYDAISWLEANIDRYDTPTSDGLITPASALRILDTEFLFRVVGTGEASIARIAVWVGTAIIALQPGSADDGAADQSVRLLIDQTFHNWTEMDIVDGRRVRIARGGGGSGRSCTVFRTTSDRNGARCHPTA